jgi:DTW domain-containing protein YfiP
VPFVLRAVPSEPMTDRFPPLLSRSVDDVVPRTLCGGCGRPERVCLCAHVTRVASRTKVVVLQHPREADVPIGTVRLLELGLEGLERHVGVSFGEEHPARRAVANAIDPPVLLFPGPGARDLRLNPPATPVTLVVIDGTWWQAQKLLKRNPFLAALPRYSLAPDAPSRYRIRREPAVHCVSTIEAIVQALTVLETRPDFSALLGPFEALVEHQLTFARETAARRNRVRPREKRPPRFATLLRERAPDFVVGYGEANAWPRGTPLGATPEVVHWAAERPATGERFEAFIAPRKDFAPTFTHHTGIERERVEKGETFASFSERWARFLRPTDLLCGWGYYASELLRVEGAEVPARLDLRRVALDVLRGRPGDVVSCAAVLGENVTPWVAGRTGLRLAALAAVLRGLASVVEGRGRA